MLDAEILETLQKYNFAKVPVYANSRYNIVGYIKIKNLLAFKFTEKNQLKSSGIVLPITKLNGNLTLLDAIDQLKLKNVNFAIVTDENGTKAIGMISLKKIFERLVLT
jgi:CBS domain containing-hemolysin-like protein